MLRRVIQASGLGAVTLRPPLPLRGVRQSLVLKAGCSTIVTLIRIINSTQSFSSRSFCSGNRVSSPRYLTTMAANSPCFQAQNVEEVTSIIKLLDDATRRDAATKKQAYSCKKGVFHVAGSSLTVESWKFNDWDFKKYNLPTYARGLFTYHHPEDDHYEIVTRGYDKFFNIEETDQTKWSWIEENTKAPYEVTVKENGCIIFISGLPDGNLLVCSKNSTGARSDIEFSHACVGEKWVDKQLASIGKTRADLARTLRDANATAVAELCDDTFEEHVLAYEGDSAGLYLHGINLNVPKFATYPADAVHEFADIWGFKKTDYFKMEDAQSLRKFLEEAAETGSWDGKDVEGFVIRCEARNGPNDPLWHNWFFKYKFEEPYLMYRQWRECTKAMINGKPPKMRKHPAITKQYLTFAARYFIDHPGSSLSYQANHGIIQVRNAFLASCGLKGSDIIRQEAEDEREGGGTSSDIYKELVLVPIATIGCGKTTIAVALTKLFGWAHVQNDNITGKKGRGNLFASAISMNLMSKPVVIADRNNHQKRERKQIFEDVSRLTPEARYVALHYVHERLDLPTNVLRQRIRAATQKRVFARGDNHQTIQAASKPRIEIEGIMEGFLNRFESLDVDCRPDDTFDSHIDLDPEADSRTNLETVVTTLKHLYPKLFQKLPTAQEYDEAIDVAMKGYTVQTKHSVGRPPPRIQPSNGPVRMPQPGGGRGNTGVLNTKKSAEYFSIALASPTIKLMLESAFSRVPGNVSAFYNKLKATGRVQDNFHITLVHNANARLFPEVWEKYNSLLNDKGDATNLGTAEVRLISVVWNNRIMAITVEILGEEFKGTNQINHITVGTRDNTVKPKESNEMLASWLKQGGTVGGGFGVVKVREMTPVEGVVKAVSRR